MKIGIVTLYGYFNFGNRLQNYALQEVVKELGHDVETIVFEKNNKSIKSKLKNVIIKENGKHKLKALNDIIRENKIKKFSNNLIKVKKYSEKLLFEGNQIDKSYDKFIVGSDQVWNPTFWRKNVNTVEFNEFFLHFASDNKKVSYAASFGIKELPEWWNDNISKELNTFSSISVREEAGADIVKKSINKEVPVVLDPTMLLSSEQWINKLQLEDNKSDYIVCFFIGERNEETKAYIKELEKKYTIIDLMDISKSKYYRSSPRDFLNYIKNAKYVLTDSFHAVVFSIIFKTKFLVFGRITKNNSNMNSRIETLLKRFNLQDRIFNGNKVDIEKCDFTYSEDILKEEKIKSIDYLKNALL